MPSDLTEMNSSLIDDGCAGCSISHPTQALPNPAPSVSPSLSPFREPCPIPQQFGQTGRSSRSSSRAGQGVVVTSEKCATSTRRGALEAATQASLTHTHIHTHVSLSSSSSAINDIWAPLCATIRLNNDAGVSPRRDGRPETGADERVRITNQS